MSGANGDNLDFLVRLSDRWAKKREEEAATMCAKRTPTEEEIDRAMVIGKWFFGWTDKTGPCPIGCMDEHWHKKLCALFEWIAVLETEASKPNAEHEARAVASRAPCSCSHCLGKGYIHIVEHAWQTGPEAMEEPPTEPCPKCNGSGSANSVIDMTSEREKERGADSP
jgi:hypothetical protein